MKRALPATPTPRAWIPAFAFSFALLAIGAGSFMLYEKHASEMERTAHDGLVAIADLKVEQIRRWLNERRRDAEIIGGDALLAKEAERWFEQGAPEGVVAQSILARLASLSRSEDYKNVLLLDATAHPRLSAGTGQEFDAPDKDLALRAIRENVVTRSEIHWSELQRPELDMVAPLAVPGAQGPRVIGAVYFRVDPTVFFFPYVQSWPAKSPSAETLLVRREGNDVLFLNELRHRKGTALKMRLPVDRALLPSAMALRGETGVTKGLDYRGVPVVAAARAVPDTPWILVAKMDRAEVEAPIRALAVTAGGVAALLMLLSALALGLWWRKQHAQSLAAIAEERFQRRVLEQHFDYSTKYARDIVLLHDESLRVVESNDAALKTYGYTREELRALEPAGLRAPEARSSQEADFRAAALTDGSLYETVHQRKDGSTFPVEISNRQIEIDRHRYYHCVVRDITKRKQTEQALARELAKHQALMATAIDGIHIVDTKGRLVEANPAFLRMLGYNKEEALRMHVTDWDARLSAEDVETMIPSLIGRAETLETQHCRKDGSIYDAEINISSFKVGDEDFFLAAARDISERKRAENEIRALNADLERRVAERTQQLEAANRAKGEFMASVTHELRTPLNSVIGFAELLKDEVPRPLNPKQVAFAADIMESGKHLLKLVEGILEMSRIDSEAAEITREDVDVAGALKDCVAAHGGMAHKRGVALRLEDTWEIGSCRVDPGALRRMLDALIDNAIRFTGEGGSVTVSARRADGALEIAVADTGIGIAREDLPKLFKPLTQLDASLARKHGGAGLGLALARRHAELHGGTIGVESEPGKGSTFTLCLRMQEQS